MINPNIFALNGQRYQENDVRQKAVYSAAFWHRTNFVKKQRFSPIFIRIQTHSPRA